MCKEKVIVMYGGSFNPPLLSHFSLAEQILNEYEEVENIVFMPVNSKYKKENLESNENRYNMVKLVTDKYDKFSVSDIEVKSNKYLYTIQTLDLLQLQYPKYKIWLTMGTDNLEELKTWKEPDKILQNYKIIILQRDKDNIENIIDNDELLSKYKDSFLIMNNIITTNMSSTYVRDKIKNGKRVKYLIPEKVYEYIENNNLYKGGIV